MNRAYKALLAGMLAIVFSGPALAHQAVQSNSGWSGGATVVLQPDGQVHVGGSIGYAVNAVYAPHQPAYYAPVQHHVAHPVCGHPSHYRSKRHHGRKHFKKRHGRHYH